MRLVLSTDHSRSATPARSATASPTANHDHVIPRPSSTINSKLATAAVAIHAALRRIVPTCHSSLLLHPRIMPGRLSRPALHQNLVGPE